MAVHCIESPGPGGGARIRLGGLRLAGLIHGPLSAYCMPCGSYAKEVCLIAVRGFVVLASSNPIRSTDLLFVRV
jgi:hypothetical protein